MRLAALCAGYGGLEMGLALAGVDFELAWYAENDPHASKVMAHHHPDASNVGDLTAITDPPPVDIVCAGFPCQPVSVAGLRKGTQDGRWLIDDVCRVARLAGAHTLVLENVTGLLSAGDGDAMGRVCQALAVNGFDRWRWTTLRASDVGAPHRRERWFCVSHPKPSESAGKDLRTTVAGPLLPTPTASQPGGTAEQHLERKRRGVMNRTDPTITDLRMLVETTDVDWAQYAPAIDRWERLTRSAPAPLTDGKLSPAFVEWMMGLPQGHVTDVPDLSRAQQLRILGNGVVPQQAAEAVRRLT